MCDPYQVTDVFLLALTIWREARGESSECREGVGHAILNRVARPSWWGHNVQDVCTKRWQFSSLTDPRDPQLTTWPQRSDASWWECVMLALDLLGGKIDNPVPGADSYYDISIPAPKWAGTARFVRQIGRVRFYDADHDYQARA